MSIDREEDQEMVPKTLFCLEVSVERRSQPETLRGERVRKEENAETLASQEPCEESVIRRRDQVQCTPTPTLNTLEVFDDLYKLGFGGEARMKN